MGKLYSFTSFIQRKTKGINWMFPVVLLVLFANDSAMGQANTSLSHSNSLPSSTIAPQRVITDAQMKNAAGEQKAESTVPDWIKPTATNTHATNSETKPNLSKKWGTSPFDQKTFVENAGQFDKKQLDGSPTIFFGAKLDGIDVYFTNTGIVYRYDKVSVKESDKEMKKGRHQNEDPKKESNINDGKDDDKDGDNDMDAKKFIHTVSYLYGSWEGSNPNLSVNAGEEQRAYRTYGVGATGTLRANTFNKITYHNVYPGIDVEYIILKDKIGLKYTVIVHPGADLGQFIMKYKGQDGALTKDDSSNVIIKNSIIGTIKESSPVGFYQENNQSVGLASVITNDEISFKYTGAYDKTKTLVIDPFASVSPSVGAGGYNRAYDADYDDAGNVYVYGGYNPFQLSMFNSAGGLVWTFTEPGTMNPLNYGGFAVDKATGISYLVEGAYDFGPGARAEKVDNTGTLVGTFNGSSSMREMWRAKYNRCTGQIVIGGGGTNSPSGQVAMMNSSVSGITPYNPLNPIIGTCPYWDVDRLAIDPTGSPAYMAISGSSDWVYGNDGCSGGGGGWGPNKINMLMSVPVPALTPYNYLQWGSPNETDGLMEVSSVLEVGPGWEAGSPAEALANGFNGMAASANWLFTYDGSTLKRVTKTTGVPSASVAISAVNKNYFGWGENDVYWGGIDVDGCENVYVGNNKSMYVYSSSLVLQAGNTVALPNTVYDIVVGANDAEVIACGNGFVEEFANTISTVTTTASPVTTTCGGCNGSATASLTLCGTVVSSGITYSWSPGGQTTQTATNLCAGTYTVTISEGCGNEYKATATVAGSVNSPPSSVSAGSNITVCVGGTINLSGSATNATSYSWSGPPGAGFASTASTSIGGATAGYAGTYTLTATNACGSATSTVAVTVNPLPSAVSASSNSPICSGNTLNLNGSASNATSYSWSGPPGAGFASTASTTIAGAPASYSGTYTLTATNGCGSATATTPVTINPTPTLTASAGPASICAGGSTTLTGGGASTYTWQPGAISGSTISVSPGSSQTYTLSGSSAAGCPAAATQTVAVTVNPTPTLTISGPATICSGNSTTLTGGGATTYTWQPGGLTGSTVSVSPAGNTTYTLSGSSAAGCPDAATQTVSVTVNTTPTLTISGPASICSGGSTVLTGGGATTYTWTPNSALSATNGSPVNADPTITTTYTLNGTSAAGCPASGSLTEVVTVSAPPTLTAVAGPASICSGGSTTLTGGNATTYTWTPGGLTGSTISVSPNVTTTYTLNGTAAGCSPSAPQTVVVNVSAPPAITAVAGPATICSGGSTTLTASGATTYTWAPGGLTSSTISVSPIVTTTYTLNGTASGCAPSTPTTVVVTVNTPPVITASAGPATICSGNSTTLTGSNATTYTWTPGGLTGSTVSVSPGVTTTYTLNGTAAGCSASPPTTVVVTVNATPTLTASAGPATICSGNSTKLTGTGASSYLWQPGALGGSTVTVSPATSTTYTLSGTSAAGCPSAATQTVAVTVNPTPTLTASAGPATICSGSSTKLTGGGATTYTWAPGGLTGSTVTVSPASTKTYTLSGTSAAGCPSAATQTVVVTVNPTPTITIAPISPTICPSGNVNLTASSTTGGTSYIWSPSGSLSASSGATVNATPVITTTYTVTPTTVAGCPGAPVTDVVSVAATLPVSVTPGTPTICNGDSIVLNASGASTFTWSPSTGLTCTTCPNPKAGPSDTTTYKVVGASGSCKDSVNVTLNVNPTPTVSINITGISAAICPGDSMGMIASGATTYVWSPVTGLSCSTCATTNAGPGSTTTYTVTGSYATGCSSTASQPIIVYPVPTMSLNLTAATLCSGDSVTLTASGVTSYSWAPPAGLNTTIGSTVVATPTATTEYIVTGKGTGGCKTKDSALITVNITPTVTVVPPTPAICAGDSLALKANGAPSYQWLPSSGLNCATCDSANASPASTTTYTVTGTSLAGCKNSATTIVTINPLPVLNITTVTPTVCKGDSAALNVTGATSYAWSPAVGLNNTTSSAVNAGPDSTVTYTVTGTNTNNCVSSSKVTITVAPIVVSGISAQPAICAGSSTTINASGATSYTWSPSTGLNTTTGGSVIANPATTTTYTLAGLAGKNCADTTNVIVTVNPLPAIGASSSSSAICSNGTGDTLSASGASSYVWSPTTGLSSSTGTPIIANPGSSATYTVTGTDVNNCVNTNTVTISVLAPPSISVSAVGGDSLCNGLSKVLNASGATSYIWRTSPVQTGSSISVSPTTNTTYTVVGSNGSCSDSSEITVDLYPNFLVGIINDTSCSNKIISVTANATGGSTPYTYVWSNGLGTNSSASVLVTPGPTTYTCNVTDGCGQALPGTVVVDGFPTTSSVFTTSADTIMGGQFVGFINSNSGASSWFWALGDGYQANLDSDIYYQYNIPGTYIVTLWANNRFGCMTSYSDTIYVIQGIFIPNVFTPNGDGQNDVFHVTVGGMQTYHIEIFNRWGQKLFMTDSPSTDWDGTSSSGVKESDGNYYYEISATDYKDKPYTYHGCIQLIRN